MADAMLGALKYKGIQRMEDIYVYDINEDRQAYFKDKFGTHAVFSVKEAMDDADIILLAVKPQNLSSVYASIEEPPKGLILSVVAGLTMEEIQANFRTSNIVRTMPNTPAMVMEGITVWIATTSTPSHMLDKVRILLESLGQQVEVHDESYLAMATAISGSGPAVRVASLS